MLILEPCYLISSVSVSVPFLGIGNLS